MVGVSFQGYITIIGPFRNKASTQKIPELLVVNLVLLIFTKNRVVKLLYF